MTISELYKQVAQLGFEDSLEDDDRFYYAANRALLQVVKIRPAIRHYLINHNPLTNLVEESTFTPIEKKIEDLTFEAENAKAYYFEADGNGVCYIEKYDENSESWRVISSITLSSTKIFIPYKGFIKEGGDFVSGLTRLRFTGEYIYNVKNVAMYEFIFSAEAADIPAYEPYTRYDLSTLVDDFLAFNCPPIKEAETNSVINQKYEVEGESTILIPYDEKAVYKVLYAKRPNKITSSGEEASKNETVIDLNEELCSLLPILIAAYVWIDDEPQKSEYYMNLYRERAIEIERKYINITPVTITSSNGW